jgi:hypothetical protein
MITRRSPLPLLPGLEPENCAATCEKSKSLGLIKELRAPRSHAKSKEPWSQDDDGPHELTQYELNCIARQLRSVPSVLYDVSGNVIGHPAGGEWDIVVPDSLGETLHRGRRHGHAAFLAGVSGGGMGLSKPRALT